MSTPLKTTQSDALLRAVIALREIAKAIEDGEIMGPHIMFPELFCQDLHRRADALEQSFRKRK